MGVLRAALIWTSVALIIAVPVFAAAQSPLLAWRSPVYIVAGFAGIAAMGLLLLQPLLAHTVLPWIGAAQSRELHKFVGVALILSVSVHVVGLWVTSPPDVIDALLYRSPTPFSAWGVTAMWAMFAAAYVAVFWRRRGLRPKTWKKLHLGLAVVVVIGSVVHAVLVEGTMETFTKIVLCASVVAATGVLVRRMFSKG